jgi:hypothetical protein
MRGPTPEARAEAKRRYESGESMNSISKVTKIDRKTLRSMKERESWITQAIPQLGATDSSSIKAEARRNVIDIATRQAISTGIVDRIAESTVLDLLGDAEITNMLVSAGKRTIQEYLDGHIDAGVNQNKADVLKSIVSANKAIFELRRMMAGKTAGDASIEMGPKLDPNFTLNIRRLPTAKGDYDRSKSA